MENSVTGNADGDAVDATGATVWLARAICGMPFFFFLGGVYFRDKLALLHFSSGVRPVIGLADMFGSKMGIYLGGRDVSMAQQLLYCAEVGPTIQHVGGKRVAEGVGCDAVFYAGLSRITL